jgi:cobalt-zinc-cadmium efflux system outer membrane protein
MNSLAKMKLRLLQTAPIMLFGIFVVYAEPRENQASSSSAILGLYIKRALERNPQLVARHQMVLADSVKIKTISALPDPAVGIGISAEPGMGVNIGKYSATQMIPWPGRTFAERRAARSGYAASAQMYKDLETEVLFKVRVAYCKLYTMIRMIALQKESLALLNRLETAALADYATSMQTQASVLKLQLEMAVTEDKIKQTEVEADMVRDELGALLDTVSGAMPDPDFQPRLAVPKSLEEARKIAMDLNPEVKAAQFEALAAGYKVSSARSMFMPDLMFSAEYTTSAGAAMSGGSKGWMLMTGISLPLWPWSKIAEVKMAKSMERSKRSTIEAEKSELANEATLAYREYFDAVRRIELLDSVLVPKARQTLVAVEESYRNAKATLMDYIDSERMLLDLQMQRITQEEQRERMAAEIVICCLATY